MIDWTEIETVLLDMDGTLLDLRYDNHFWMEYLPAAYAKKHGITSTLAKEHLSTEFEAVRGTLPWYCLEYWSGRLGMDIPTLKRELQSMIRARPFTLEFLSWLRGSRQNLFLVTNAHQETLNIKMAQVDITLWFDSIVVSHKYNAPKESQVFWQRFQEEHPFDPETTLFIDDTETVLDAARQFGVKHLLTMLQPDSAADKRLSTRFPAIHHFDEIMPGYTEFDGKAPH